jgi:hypothetical protein
MTHISILVQKESNAKKESFAAQNLKDCSPSLPLKTRYSKKQENQSFLSRQFYTQAMAWRLAVYVRRP